MLASSARNFLGLSHNPFTETDDGFFPGAGRQQVLESLRHLSQWSKRVLLITGVEGAGKTTLYRRLSASLEPRVKAARIDAALISGRREVLAAIAQGFGVAHPADANTELLLEVLTAHLTEQVGEKRRCLVLVDNAHRLQASVLPDVLQLSGSADESDDSEPMLHLVLFGETLITTLVRDAAGSLGATWHEIQLADFPAAEVRDYLQWRFRQANYRGNTPFTDLQVEDLAKLSDGLPGAINKIASEHLVNLELGNMNTPISSFPTTHRMLVVVLVAIFALLYLLLLRHEAVQRLPVAAAPEATTVQESPGNDVPVVRMLEEMASLETGSTGEPADLAEPVAPAPPPVVEPQLVTNIQPNQVAAEPKGSRATPRQTPAKARSVIAQTASPVEPVAVVERSVTANQDSSRNGRWLLGQDSQAFTLQLITLSDETRLANFVKRQSHPEDFATFRVNRDGETFHVLTYGVYKDREAAESAARRLPQEVGKINPWIRPMASVHKAINTATE